MAVAAAVVGASSRATVKAGPASIADALAALALATDFAVRTSAVIGAL